VMRFDATIPMFALCVATGCVVRPPSLTASAPSLTASASVMPSGPDGSPEASPEPPPTPAPTGGHVATRSTVTEIGCTVAANDIGGDTGSVFWLSCPPGCANDPQDIQGTEVYSGYSAICVAAIHAGVTTDAAGGEFTLVLEGNRPGYRGSTRNGIKSRDSGSFHRSYRFQR
jgi:hypothetical protein